MNVSVLTKPGAFLAIHARGSDPKEWPTKCADLNPQLLSMSDRQATISVLDGTSSFMRMEMWGNEIKKKLLSEAFSSISLSNGLYGKTLTPMPWQKTMGGGQLSAA
mmetsp:Transcript_88559/g.198008  ORF Transcript_88559/g.198008 Transcript_88559/m.198008 type:complete len:106 (-) Transcript_88559:589-906(-)